ncbi:phosphotransferase, partial [Bosea sp. (in: a-proteobacteria)]|uniref:phosphotransferase n=1 Tax=Bosea sp. (in: a-proteobacteria) TaxID=1871050 RepID=UPI001ACBBF40
STLTGKIDVASAADVWAAALSSEWRSRPLWVHGDMALGNLLVRGGELCAVIDFGGLAVGDPACDLVMAWTEFSGDSRTMFRTRLPFDDDTWKRARGWALWKALITIAEAGQDQLSRKRARVVVAEVIADHRATTVG